MDDETRQAFETVIKFLDKEMEAYPTTLLAHNINFLQDVLDA